MHYASFHLIKVFVLLWNVHYQYFCPVYEEDSKAGALESELFSVCGREHSQWGIISDRLRP